MTDDCLEHYGAGVEEGRVDRGTSSLEFERTKELLDRFLPPPPASVLDVGGGPGAYSAWLAERGYRTHLIDPVPLHVEQAVARATRLRLDYTAAVGDARALEEGAVSWDAVLMLGPLYHLTKRRDRIQALREARRVVRPGGVVAAALISRFASLFDAVVHGYFDDPAFAQIVDRDLREGQHRNPTGNPDWFTTAYFHRPEEIPDEFGDAGLRLEGLFGIEGLGHLVPDLLDEPGGRARLVRAARAIEREPSLSGLSDHLLAIGRPG
jgi:ubiquinone/menaquinone biosynthesis C-methylase UbiE